MATAFIIKTSVLDVLTMKFFTKCPIWQVVKAVASINKNVKGLEN